MAFLRRQHSQIRKTLRVYLTAYRADITELTGRGRVLAVQSFHERQRQGAPANPLRSGYQVSVAQFFWLGVFL